MRSAATFAIIAAILLAACQTTSNVSPATQGNAGVTFAGGDGSSMDAAIIVNARTDSAGTHAIYAWLKQHCNCKVTRQSLVNGAGRVFDLMEGEQADGTKVSYYFDITKSFGKW